MWDLAVREQDYASAQAMLQRYRGAPPWSNRALLAFVRKDSVARASLLEEAKASENRQVQIAARFVATYLGDLASAEELSRLELKWRRQPAIRQGAQLLLGWLELGRGRWSSARPAFLAAEHEGAAAGRVHRALAASLPFLVVPRSDLLAVRAEIEAWTPERDAEERTATATALRPHLRLYLLGLLSSRLDQPAEARSYLAQLERLPVQPGSAGVIRGLAQTIRSDVAWQSGAFKEVLTALGEVTPEIPLELVSVPAYVIAREYTLEHARYLRAAALAALGRDSEALRWLGYGLRGAPNEFAFLAPLNRLLGEIRERAGDRAAAIENYERLVHLWQDGDPPQRAAAAEVGGRLRRLRDKP
jgi:tetratricopeptide (TPR) repeat protein